MIIIFWLRAKIPMENNHLKFREKVGVGGSGVMGGGGEEGGELFRFKLGGKIFSFFFKFSNIDGKKVSLIRLINFM